MLRALFVLAAITAIFRFDIVRAERIVLRLKSGQEMLLKIDEQRKITGEVRTNSNTTAALVDGGNSSLGHIELHLENRTDASIKGSFVYEYRPCGHSTMSLYKNPECAAPMWVSQQAPSHLSRLEYCFDDCKLFKVDDESESFDAFVNWSTSWDSYVGTLTISKKRPPSVLKCLQDHGITARFDADYSVTVPPGLENAASSILSQCGLGKASPATTEKGSSTIPLTFPAGTFFDGPLSLANISEKVASVTASLQQGLTAEGLDTQVRQGSIGGMAFIITVTAHSDRFPFPAGNWFQSVVEFDLTERPEPHVPQGKVQQGELHVIGTRIFYGPSSVHPAQNQFQSIARVDKALDDGPVDSVLSIELANRLASRFRGAIVATPEGF